MIIYAFDGSLMNRGLCANKGSIWVWVWLCIIVCRSWKFIVVRFGWMNKNLNVGWMCNYCDWTETGTLNRVRRFTYFSRCRETRNSRILMHCLAIGMSRQAMKVGQHSVLGWFSEKMKLGIIENGSDSHIAWLYDISKC